RLSIRPPKSSAGQLANAAHGRPRQKPRLRPGNGARQSHKSLVASLRSRLATLDLRLATLTFLDRVHPLADERGAGAFGLLVGGGVLARELRILGGSLSRSACLTELVDP